MSYSRLDPLARFAAVVCFLVLAMSGTAWGADDTPHFAIPGAEVHSGDPGDGLEFQGDPGGSGTQYYPRSGGTSDSSTDVDEHHSILVSALSCIKCVNPSISSTSIFWVYIGFSDTYQIILKNVRGAL